MITTSYIWRTHWISLWNVGEPDVKCLSGMYSLKLFDPGECQLMRANAQQLFNLLHYLIWRTWQSLWVNNVSGHCEFFSSREGARPEHWQSTSNCPGRRCHATSRRRTQMYLLVIKSLPDWWLPPRWHWCFSHTTCTCSRVWQYIALETGQQGWWW